MGAQKDVSARRIPYYPLGLLWPKRPDLGNRHKGSVAVSSGSTSAKGLPLVRSVAKGAKLGRVGTGSISPSPEKEMVQRGLAPHSF